MGGFKEYVENDEVLADDINEYVMRQVVTQFATAAVRSADLSSPVEGQCSTLDTAGGLLYVWDGTAWMPHAPMRATELTTVPTAGTDVEAPFVQAGLAQLTTDANGLITVVFPEPFAAAPPVIVVTDRTATSGTLYQYGVSHEFPGQFGVYACNDSGAAVVSSTLRFSWLAIGERA